MAALFPHGTGVAADRLGTADDPLADTPGMCLPMALRDAVPARQREFLAGRSCAQRALHLAGAQEAREISIGPLRAPQWPAGFSGSISHSAGFVAAVAAPWRSARGLGLDLEAVVTAEQAAALQPLIGRRDEWARLARSGADPAIHFTLLFSAKEALFKCLAPRVGRYFDFLDVELISVDAQTVTLALRIALASDLAAGHPQRVAFRRLDALLVCGTSLGPEVT